MCCEGGIPYPRGDRAEEVSVSWGPLHLRKWPHGTPCNQNDNWKYCLSHGTAYRRNCLSGTINLSYYLPPTSLVGGNNLPNFPFNLNRVLVLPPPLHGELAPHLGEIWIRHWLDYSCWYSIFFLPPSFLNTKSYLSKIWNCLVQWQIQDFPRGGGCANFQKCYYFSNICRKLHENERIWTPRGGAHPWRPPLDPPMQSTATTNHKTEIFIVSLVLLQYLTEIQVRVGFLPWDKSF